MYGEGQLLMQAGGWLCTTSSQREQLGCEEETTRTREQTKVVRPRLPGLASYAELDLVVER